MVVVWAVCPLSLSSCWAWVQRRSGAAVGSSAGLPTLWTSVCSTVASASPGSACGREAARTFQGVWLRPHMSLPGCPPAPPVCSGLALLGQVSPPLRLPTFLGPGTAAHPQRLTGRMSLLEACSARAASGCRTAGTSRLFVDDFGARLEIFFLEAQASVDSPLSSRPLVQPPLPRVLDPTPRQPLRTDTPASHGPQLPLLACLFLGSLPQHPWSHRSERRPPPHLQGWHSLTPCRAPISGSAA